MTEKKGKYHNDLINYAINAKKNNSPYPKRFCFVLTNLCNLACTFCFQDRKRQDGAMTDVSDDVSFKRFVASPQYKDFLMSTCADMGSEARKAMAWYDWTESEKAKTRGTKSYATEGGASRCSYFVVFYL